MADKPHMSPQEFRDTLKLLDLTIGRDCDLLLVSKAALYSYAAGTAPIPAHLAALLRIMLYQRQDPASVMALAFPLSQSRLPR